MWRARWRTRTHKYWVAPAGEDPRGIVGTSKCGSLRSCRPAALLDRCDSSSDASLTIFYSRSYDGSPIAVSAI